MAILDTIDTYQLKQTDFTCLLLFLFLTLGKTLHAQAPADSLQRLLSEYPQRDSQRCELLYQLGKGFVKGSNERLRQCAVELLDIAESIRSPLFRMRANMMLGVSFIREGTDVPKALDAYEKALAIAKSQHGREWRRREAQVYINLSSVFLNLDRLDSARKYSRRGIDILEVLHDTLILADNYNAHGLILKEMDLPDSALLFMRKADALYRAAGALNQQAGLNCSMGNIYLKQHRLKEALSVCTYCWNNTDSAAYPSQKLHAASSLGMVYAALGRCKSAEAYMSRALKMARTLGLTATEEEVCAEIASMYNQCNRLDSALYYHDLHLGLYSKRLQAERDNQVHEMETRFRVKENEYENALLRSEKRLLEKQKETTWWSLAAILLAIAGSIRYVWQRWRRRMREKTEALEAFNYSVSHDLRNPLQNARQWMEYLRNDIEQRNDKDIDTDLAYISRSLDQLQEMLNGMLQWFSAEPSPPYYSVFPVQSLVEEIWQQYQHTGTTGIHFLADHLPAVRADKMMLRLIFDNLIGNAIKFTRESAHPEIAVSCVKVRGYWQFQVSDNGVGFTPAAREHLFRLFKTAHRRDRFPGTGIGLALVRRLVEKQGGKVSAESQGEGKGAVITFTLPR